MAIARLVWIQESRASSRFFHMGRRAPNNWTSLCCFPRCLSWDLDHKWKSQDSKWYPGVTLPIVSAPMPSLFKSNCCCKSSIQPGMILFSYVQTLPCSPLYYIYLKNMKWKYLFFQYNACWCTWHIASYDGKNKGDRAGTQCRVCHTKSTNPINI